MCNSLEIKKQLLHKVQEILDNKVEDLSKAILSAKESRDSDTKSSAGDKYETGRAMMHIEIEKNEVQLNKTLKLKNELNRISFQNSHAQVAFGSVVKTNAGKYFISVAIGKVEVNNDTYYSISLASPIGQALLGKKLGDSVLFQGRNIVIEYLG